MALEFRIQFLMKSKNMFKFRILIDPHKDILFFKLPARVNKSVIRHD